VEDNLDILTAVEEALAGEGWEVVAAASAEEDSVAGRAGGIDLVLCDILLNDGRNGRTVKEAFAAELGLGHLPFAFMTASPREAIRLTDQHVLRKPFGTSEVVAFLNQALGAEATKQAS